MNLTPKFVEIDTNIWCFQLQAMRVIEHTNIIRLLAFASRDTLIYPAMMLSLFFIFCVDMSDKLFLV